MKFIASDQTLYDRTAAALVLHPYDLYLTIHRDSKNKEGCSKHHSMIYTLTVLQLFIFT